MLRTVPGTLMGDLKVFLIMNDAAFFKICLEPHEEAILGADLTWPGARDDGYNMTTSGALMLYLVHSQRLYMHYLM